MRSADPKYPKRVIFQNDPAARESSFVNARLRSLSLGSLSLRYNSTWLTARRSASAAVPT
jgi:hypothetical protein